MAEKKAKTEDKQDKKEWKPTFKKIDEMTNGEKAALNQGFVTARNIIEERLGLRKPYEK